MGKVADVLKAPGRTALCVGPLSANIVAEVMHFSERVPLVLVASRRQIECEEFGGGYVNGWTTELFAEHIRRGVRSNVILERDHGGPWQGRYEISKNFGVEQSMAIAKRSYEVDIDSGFDILHIDPSVEIGNEVLKTDTVLERLFELYEHVVEYSNERGKDIEIELGAEGQSGGPPDIEAFRYFADKIDQFCSRKKYRKPMFVVLQTGAKVFELRNAGAFESSMPSVRLGVIQMIRQCVQVAKQYGIAIKEHNADYLSVENLILRPYLGISASNVAPELGTAETTALMAAMRTFGSERELQQFISIVDKSLHWKKWTSSTSSLSPYDKARIAGHYCFSDKEVVELKKQVADRLSTRGIELDEYLRLAIRMVIHKYATAYRLI